MLSSLAAMVTAAGIILTVTGAYAWLRGRGAGPGLALSGAILFVLSFFSSTVQIMFLAHNSSYHFLIEIMAALSAAAVILGRKKLVAGDIHTLLVRVRKSGLLQIFSALYLYLAVQVLLLPPYNWDSIVYGLPRVQAMIAENSLFPQNLHSARQVLFPPGFDALSFFFLRGGSDCFLALPSFLCFTALSAAALELVSAGGNPSLRLRCIGLAAIMIVICQTQVILQATNTKNDLAAAAAAAVALAGCAAFVRSGIAVGPGVTLVALAAGMSFKSYFPGFVLPFLAVLLPSVWMSRPGLVRLRNFPMPLTILSGVILFLLLIFHGHNHLEYDSPFRKNTIVSDFTNHDGWRGASANLGRYLLQGIEWPRFLGGGMLDTVHDRGLGSNRLTGAWKQTPAMLMSSARLTPNGILSWFGPAGWLVVLPAVVWGMARGPALIRGTGLTLAGFYIAVCTAVAWAPWHGRYFLLFYACSAGCVAYFLSSFRIRKLRLLIAAALMMGWYAALFNESKPFFDYSSLTGISASGTEGTSGWFFFHWMQDVLERDRKYALLYGREAMDYYDHKIPTGSRVLILAGEESGIFPLLLKRRDLRKITATSERVALEGGFFRVAEAADFALIMEKFDFIVTIGVNPQFPVPLKPVFAAGGSPAVSRFTVFDLR
ncbi:MAG: hypothetical protein PHQ23_03915 [Candidatus Wallbacteria bacterium]|nr:hypothetical protein [Candidatus Wallbacteria bacterium]